jgi:hypothetical protein
MRGELQVWPNIAALDVAIRSGLAFPKEGIAAA